MTDKIRKRSCKHIWAYTMVKPWKCICIKCKQIDIWAEDSKGAKARES